MGFGDFKEGVGKFKKQMLGHKSSQNLENVYDDDENQRFSDINPINDDVDVSSTYNERGSKETPKKGTVLGNILEKKYFGRPKFPGNNQANNRNTTRKTGKVINLNTPL